VQSNKRGVYFVAVLLQLCGQH